MATIDRCVSISYLGLGPFGKDIDLEAALNKETIYHKDASNKAGDANCEVLLRRTGPKPKG